MGTGARAPSDCIAADDRFDRPDGLAFDSFGWLWIQTDGGYSNVGDFVNMGNNQMPAADVTTKEIPRSRSAPRAARSPA